MRHKLRKGSLVDLPDIQKLFTGVVEAVCSPDYSQEQIKAWISSVEDKQRWLDVLSLQFVVIAFFGKQIAGFGSLGDGGYIDMLYVDKDCQGLGIASSILNRLEEEAIRCNQTHLYSNVSRTAKSFFEKNGFRLVTEQVNIRQGVGLINYKMVKDLGHPE